MQFEIVISSWVIIYERIHLYTIKLGYNEFTVTTNEVKFTFFCSQVAT